MGAWRGRRPLSWQDFLMNPIGVGMNYLTMPDIRDVRKKELAEGGLVQPKKNTREYHDKFWSIPSTSNETSEDTAVTTINKAQKDSAVNLETDRSIAATNARSSLISAAEGTERRMASSSSKGSVGRNLLTLQQMREAQTPVETVKSSTPISTQNNKAGFDYSKFPSLNINYSSPPKNWDPGAAFNMSSNTGGGGKGGLFADAKSTGNTLSSISNIAGMIAKLQQKEATPSISPGENAGDDDLYGQYYAPSFYA